jgi:1-acyl-sn-glycerol-3-phosphate acyltransferase
MSQNSLTLSHRWSLNLQRFTSFFFYPTWSQLISLFLYGIMGYRLKNVHQIRKKFLEILKTHDGPVLICSNHLTLIDSLIVFKFLGGTWNYFKHFDRFPWSLPEVSNFYRNIWLKIFSYLGKCIPIARGNGLRGNKTSLDKVRYVLDQGHFVSLFPEGQRSRDGKINPQETSYAAGEILEQLNNPLVICLYMRGKDQSTYSNFPKRGEIFEGSIDFLKPQSHFMGLRAKKDLSLKVINKLKIMEDEFLEQATRRA